MATTNELIDGLVADLAPVRPGGAWRRLALGTGLGLAVSAILMLVWLGPRADMHQAMGTTAFWIKFAYTLLLGLAGLAALNRLSHPAGRARAAAILGGVVFAILVAMAFADVSAAPEGARMPMVMGHSANVCPLNIVILSLPIGAGVVWAMRGLAPTRLGPAGLAAGWAAGGLGAWVYSFHCTEVAVPFLVSWYTLGIVIVGVLGAVTGRLLLRW